MRALRAGALVLEPQVAAHAAEMFGVLSDPAIYEFENAAPESEQWLARRFARLESRRSPDGAQVWLNWVIRLESGEVAGYVQATLAQDGCAHIAYELGSRFWRRGIATAAVEAMLAEVATTYSAPLAVAIVKACNHRSLGFLRSVGFSATPPAGGLAAGHAADEVVMYRRYGTGLPSLHDGARPHPE